MTSGLSESGDRGGNGNDSSESETENNEDLGTSVKFLLLARTFTNLITHPVHPLLLALFTF